MYSYADQKKNIFTEDGQVMFLKIRDHVNGLLAIAGALTMERAITGRSGDSWDMLACIDRLVELGEIREVTGQDVAGQHRIFTR